MLFNEENPLSTVGAFKSHQEETQRLLDQFWTRFRQLTIEQMLSTQNSRFSGEILPQVNDIVGIQDKLGRCKGFGIGKIIEVKESHDGEPRVCKVRMARKSKNLCWELECVHYHHLQE